MDRSTTSASQVEEPAHRVGPCDRLVGRWLFAATACLLLAVANGLPKLSDEVSMIELARSMLYDGSFQVPDLPFVGVPGRGGELVSKYGAGQPILSMPFDLAGAVLSAPLDDPKPLRQAITTAVVPLASALLVAWTFLLARRIGARPIDAAGVAVATLVGSLLLVYATEYFAEPLVALLLVVTVERAVGRHWTQAYGSMALAIVVHPRVAPAVAVLAFVVLVHAGLRRAVASAWPVVLAVVFLLAYNAGRFGDPLETGYVDEGFTTPLRDGLIGLFFTGSKSLLLFAPLAIAGALALWRLAPRVPVATQLIAGFSLVVLVLTATWHSWYGGWSWGPRFLAPVVPLLTVPLAPWLSADRRRWGAILVLAVVGFLVSVPAVIAPSSVQNGTAVIGPSIIDQYRLVPDVVSSGLAGSCQTPAQPDELDCMPALWQVHVARSVGPVGDTVVVLVTAALIVGCGYCAGRVRKAIAAAESLA